MRVLLLQFLLLEPVCLFLVFVRLFRLMMYLYWYHLSYVCTRIK